jgi:hypothetical protein
MVTKKQRKIGDVKKKKRKKSRRLLILSAITLAVFGSLIFLFVTLFDSLYPPVTGKGEGAYARKEKWVATLYFSDANERFLIPEKRRLLKDKDSAGQARELVEALLDGPKTKLAPTFPKKTELQSVKIEDGQKAMVSFNKNLIRNHPGGSASEMATIYSLTNTLTANILAIKEVKLLIDGKEVDSIGGHINTRRPFVQNKDILAPGLKEG